MKNIQTKKKAAYGFLYDAFGAWGRISVLSVSRHPPESPRICRAVRHRESDHSEYTDSPSGQTRPIFQPFPVLTSNLSLHPSLRLSHTHQTCPFLYPETCCQWKQIRESPTLFSAQMLQPALDACNSVIRRNIPPSLT